MRPPEFTGGNLIGKNVRELLRQRFNEAAGIHRRKPRYREVYQGGSFWLQ